MLVSLPKKSKKSKNSAISICNKEWIVKKNNPYKAKFNKEISLIDLYSGCGGMTLGVLEAAFLNKRNLSIKMALDMNKAALGVYKKNFSVNEEIAFTTDINNLVSINIGKPLNSQEKKIKKKYKNVDVIVAGPPCQGHSNLNNHTRRKDPRNDLYLNAIRFVEILRPKVAIIENVSTVIHDKSNIVQQAEIAMKSLGYHIYSMIIDTSKFGLAQKRKRHLQIAINTSKINLDINTFLTKKKIPLSNYIGDIINEHTSKKGIFYTPSNTKKINKKRIDYLFEKNIYDLPDEQRPDCHSQKSHSYKSCYGRMHWDKPAQTITSGFGSMGQGRYIHPLQKRVITPHEAARIQGFPDFFSFQDVTLRGELHTMIANAVPPKIIAMIIHSIIQNKLL